MHRVRVEPGQLRRWRVPDHPKDQDKLFMIVHSGHERVAGEVLISDPVWSFIIDGHKEWHFEDIIERDSEVIE